MCIAPTLEKSPSQPSTRSSFTVFASPCLVFKCRQFISSSCLQNHPEGAPRSGQSPLYTALLCPHQGLAPRDACLSLPLLFQRLLGLSLRPMDKQRTLRVSIAISLKGRKPRPEDHIFYREQQPLHNHMKLLKGNVSQSKGQIIKELDVKATVSPHIS